METHYEFQSPFYRRIIAQARAEGHNEGLNQGRKEATKDAVRNLLATGYSREETALLLGLTAEEMDAV